MTRCRLCHHYAPHDACADCTSCQAAARAEAIDGWLSRLVRIPAKGEVMADHAEQSMPVPNDRQDIQSLVIEDIRVRREVGIERYGTPLQPFNGRDALRDAYEEALDLAMYLRQAIAERDTP